MVDQAQRERERQSLIQPLVFGITGVQGQQPSIPNLAKFVNDLIEQVKKEIRDDDGRG